jgi:hypothetical protein
MPALKSGLQIGGAEAARFSSEEEGAGYAEGVARGAGHLARPLEQATCSRATNVAFAGAMISCRPNLELGFLYKPLAQAEGSRRVHAKS